MDLPSLLNSLSLDDTNSNIANYAARINDIHTEFLFGKFTNQSIIIVTQFGKIGSLFSVRIDQPANGLTITEPVYAVQTIFGRENLLAEAAARFIVEQLNIQKPLLICLNLKNYDRRSVLSIVEAIKNYSPDTK